MARWAGPRGLGPGRRVVRDRPSLAAMTKVRVAVVFGGRSSEHAISCVSAGSVLTHLDRDRFEVVAVGIAPDGRWVHTADDPDALRIDGRALPAVEVSAPSAVV